MSTVMVDRVARAIHDRDGSVCADWERHEESVRDDYRDLARAAIEALREPNAAMLEAVIPYPQNTAAPRYLMEAAVAADRLAYITRWQDGIDAALRDAAK